MDEAPGGREPAEWEIRSTLASGARLIVRRGTEIVYESPLRRKCVGDRVAAVRAQLRAPSIEDCEGSGAEGVAWADAWRRANDAAGNSSRDAEGMRKATSRGKAWSCAVPIEDLQRDGFVIADLGLSQEECDGLLAYVKRHTKGAAGRRYLAGAVQEAAGGTRASFRFTEEEWAATLLALKLEHPGRAAQEAAIADEARAAHVPTEEEEKLVQRLLTLIEERTSSVEEGADGRPRQAGLSPGNAAHVSLQYDTAGDRSRVGPWQGDDDGPPSLAVIVGLSPSWTAPFFVDIAGRTSSGASYKAARQLRWEMVRESGNNMGESVPIACSDTVCRSWSASHTPLSLPGRNEYGTKVYRRGHGEAHSAAQEPRRYSLAAGQCVIFDPTCPRSQPGTMPTEGERAAIYVGYQGTSAYRQRGAPMLVFPPVRDGSVAGEHWHPVFDEQGKFLLKEGSGSYGGKRRRDAEI